MAIISIIRCLQVLAAPIRLGIGNQVLAGIRLLLLAVLLAPLLVVLMALLLRLNGQNTAVDVSLVHFAVAFGFYFTILPSISARCNSCCSRMGGEAEPEAEAVAEGGEKKKSG